MLFNSAAFMFYFLPAAVLGFVLLGRLGRTAVVVWLALMSLVFYAVWNPKYLFVLGGSMLMNYAFSRLIIAAKTQRGKTVWMIAGVAANLGVLAYFKYLFRFLVFMNQLQFTNAQWSHIVLPLGISFFTFTQIAYLVDLRQGEAEPQDFASFALFVTFFPHLIAGPILHHREIMPQFSEERRFRLDWNDFAVGVSWFILGLGKKVIIADRIAQFSDATFAHPHGLGMVQSWIGALNYAMQLYFDFSGYSDMAIGLARMFSIRFPLNFNSPYKSLNIIDFWSRWHMTLTRYITLYIYNPVALAVNRRRMAKGKAVSRKASRTVAGFLMMVGMPTAVTMFLAGVWHGAGLQFIIFGLLHAMYLSVNHAWRIWRQPAKGAVVAQRSRLSLGAGVAASWALTFVCVVIAEVFFRADSTRDAMALVAGMFGAHGLGLNGIMWPPAIAARLHVGAATAYSLEFKSLAVLALFPVVWLMPNTQQIMGHTQADPKPWLGWLYRTLQWRPNAVWGVGLACTMLLVLMYITYTSSFLYFQF
jgi:alginate O-acetyltransferase complex protein AlgI